MALQAHRDLAREAVRKSLVLLKNGKNADDPMIPLPKKAPRILVAGTHAHNLGYQCGGWTTTWQGVRGNNHTAGKKSGSGVIPKKKKKRTVSGCQMDVANAMHYSDRITFVFG